MFFYTSVVLSPLKGKMLLRTLLFFGIVTFGESSQAHIFHFEMLKILTLFSFFMFTLLQCR